MLTECVVTAIGTISSVPDRGVCHASVFGVTAEPGKRRQGESYFMFLYRVVSEREMLELLPFKEQRAEIELELESLTGDKEFATTAHRDTHSEKVDAAKLLHKDAAHFHKVVEACTF